VDLSFLSDPSRQASVALEKNSVYKVKSDSIVLTRDLISTTKSIKTNDLPPNASASLSRSASSRSMSSKELGYRRIEKKRLSAKKKPEEFVVNECRIMSVCAGHPNIVTMVDFWCDDEAYFQILHPCPSESLQEVLATRNPLTEKQAANVVAQIASALYFLHSIGIVHGNILPVNVQLRDAWSDLDNSVALCGFGYSRLLSRQATLEETKASFESEYAVVGQGVFDGPSGNVNCLSPEEIPSSPWPLTAKMDTFQLGVLLYQLLSGNIHPFIPPSPVPSDLNMHPRSVVQVLENIAKGTYYPLTGSRFVHLTPECKQLISSLLCPDPVKRPTSRQVLEGEWISLYVRKTDIQYLGEVSRRKGDMILAADPPF
jgi:serine/threonine protein kinase